MSRLTGTSTLHRQTMFTDLVSSGNSPNRLNGLNLCTLATYLLKRSTCARLEPHVGMALKLSTFRQRVFTMPKFDGAPVRRML